MAFECSQNWSQVKAIQSELQEIESASISSENPTLHVLKEREKRLKAELLNVRTKELALPPQGEMQLLQLSQHEQKLIDEYKEYLAFLNDHIIDQKEELRKAQEEEITLKQFNADLKEKVSALQLAKQREKPPTLQMVLQEMQTQADEIQETHHHLKSALKRILSTKCPTPSPAEVRSTLNQSQIQDVDTSRIMGMKHIVGELVQQTMRSPGQPYITLDPRMLPAHVEFLLRCQMVVQHPDDPKKIRLVPFHM